MWFGAAVLCTLVLEHFMMMHCHFEWLHVIWWCCVVCFSTGAFYDEAPLQLVLSGHFLLSKTCTITFQSLNMHMSQLYALYRAIILWLYYIGNAMISWVACISRIQGNSCFMKDETSCLHPTCHLRVPHTFLKQLLQQCEVTKRLTSCFYSVLRLLGIHRVDESCFWQGMSKRMCFSYRPLE